MNALAADLLKWYDANAMVLPWRSDPSPYHTWVSEVMLQQTQVETVIPYFERFMQRFPTMESLAKADQAEVLQLWEGLGYYSRARNLHKAAQLVWQKHQGQLPPTYTELLRLPGVGSYIASAIASIAFQQPVPALDANCRRVYIRLLNLQTPLGTPALDHTLWDYAEQLLPQERPGDFNQAVMELGERICKPKAPLCKQCPLQNYCQAFAQGTQNSLPQHQTKPPVPHYTVTAAVITQSQHVLIAQRPPDGLLGGLWEFPGGKLEPEDRSLEDCLKREIREELELEIAVDNEFGVYRHAYTHFKITLHAFLCTLIPGQSTKNLSHVRWVLPAQLDEFAMGKVDRQIARRLQQSSVPTP
jgi:A/G-specific adenine glycosylase